MKIHSILCAAAIAVPQLALAEASSTGMSLGTVQATLDFCVQVNPGGAAKYREQLGQMTRDVPGQELDEARQTPEYKEAYEETRASLGAVAMDDAREACVGLLEPEPSAPSGPVSRNEGTHHGHMN